MEDNDIYDELQDYDSNYKNKYEEHWGTLLNFLDDSNLDEAAISGLAKPEENEDQNNNFLQNYDLNGEMKSDKKHKNMAEVYRDQSTMLNSNQKIESPDMNYVYQSKKKAVVMVRK